MSQHGLIAKGTSKNYRKSPNKKPYDKKEKILNRVFTATERNKVWVGDTTYIPTKHGFFTWLHLLTYIQGKLLGGQWIRGCGTR